MNANNFLAISFCCITVLSACSNPKHSTKSSGSTVATMNDTTIAATETVTDRKWKLIELMGKPVADSVNGKIPFIILRMTDSIYTANGGCNGLSGKFVLDEKTLRIQFKQGISTMMACPDMSVEDGLKNVLANTDNYTFNDSILSLNKARMAPLARFKAVE
jgi:heat shock protein HslJ